MRPKYCRARNYASFASLDIDLSQPGLILIYGSTGSGKSTFMDIPCWGMFGTTAKNIAVDEVVSWGAIGDTVVETEVELDDGTELVVIRKRGKVNDLFFTEGGNIVRGKDARETQKLLEQRLGVTADLYFTTAYFHEFAETAAFFAANAKARRALFERIAPLKFATTLSERCTKERKTANQAKIEVGQRLVATETRYQTLADSRKTALMRSGEWETKKAQKITALKEKYTRFEEEKKQNIAASLASVSAWDNEHTSTLEKLRRDIAAAEKGLPSSMDYEVAAARLKKAATCAACGSLPKETTEALNNIHRAAIADGYARKKFDDIVKEYKHQESLKNPKLYAFEAAKSVTNTYGLMLQDAENEDNPYREYLEQSAEQLDYSAGELQDVKAEHAWVAKRLANVEQLQDLCGTLRATMLHNAIASVEMETNRILSTFFDAEMRVAFQVEDDNLEVEIIKDGHSCRYPQLSKGQRGILKLAFSVALMATAADSNGTHVGTMWLDEALDGLDASFKMKAYRLFEELATRHTTVFVIDHATEFQNLFAQKIRIQLVDDISVAQEQYA
jgi:DNA repair exonuclease SbcCD ATPase subunit